MRPLAPSLSAIILPISPYYSALLPLHPRFVHAFPFNLGVSPHPLFLSITKTRALDRYEAAEELQTAVLAVGKRIFGPVHPETLSAMANLAATYSNQGHDEKAEKLETAVLEGFKRVFGLDHPITLNSMNNLASTYSAQGRHREAEALEAMKRVLAPEHSTTLTCMYNLANTYYDRGLYREVEQVHKAVLEVRKRVLGSDHPNTLQPMITLALYTRIKIGIKR